MTTTHTSTVSSYTRRLVMTTAVGLSALSIALAAPAAAKGPHPGPVIDRAEPTSSLSAQTNDGVDATPPVTNTQHSAPGSLPRRQPATSTSAQQNRGVLVRSAH